MSTAMIPTDLTASELAEMRVVLMEFIDDRMPELIEWMTACKMARRSSMPIYLDDVAVLAMATLAVPALLDRLEQHEGQPCGQVTGLLVGRLSGPCVIRGRHTEHRADNGDVWTESVR
jgi:hypothetical protein